MLAVAMLMLSAQAQAQNTDAIPVSFRPAGSKASGIVFTESTWTEALKLAADTRKYVFVDAYASWCGPCKLLKATTFRNKGVAAFFNEHFINLSIDMEKGEGTELSARWRIEAYPTLIIFDGTGRPVLKAMGYLKPKELMKFAQEALSRK